jgi:hypothetical protein
MSERISPPSWTEWTRNPSERSSARKAFDEILGDLRKDGLIEIKGSLFVHLARYSYLHIKNARIDVESFIHSVPESTFQSVPPTYRQAEVDSMLTILVNAGLATIESGSSAGITTVILTEKQGAGEVARAQVLNTLLSHLRDVLSKWDPADLVSRSSSFPTVASVAKATGVDRAYLMPGEGCTALDDRPETNETNPNPFLQETVDQGGRPLVLMQFWPLPDQKGTPTGPDPEFSLVMTGDRSIAATVREQCIPVLTEFFRSNDHHEAGAEIQAKYASYMHKYREKFASSSAAHAGDRIDKVLATADPEGEAFANAVYVAVQVLRSLGRSAAPSGGRGSSTVVYQAARIAYAHVMALRVRKRKDEKTAAARVQDTALLVARLRDSNRPLTVEELRKTTDSTKNSEIGAKYSSVLELLPLAAPKEGSRPPVFEIRGAFVHRENLIKTFLDLRESEGVAQRERLAQEWASAGIPPVEEIFLPDRAVSPDFLRVWELMHQERVLAVNLPDFLKDFVPGERDVLTMSRLLWPEGHRGAITPLEVVTRGLDPILYEDKDRLRRRSLAGVLNISKSYPAIVKAAWNLVFMQDGLFRFILRKIAAFFGGRPAARPEKEVVAKASAPTSASGSASAASAPDPRAQKMADLKKLKTLAPALQNREQLVMDREKLASQWNIKLDGEAARKTRQVVDDEVARLALKIPLEQLSEENSAKVALYLIEKSGTLSQVTGSRYFNRYLYLTALLRRSDTLGR